MADGPTVNVFNFIQRVSTGNDDCVCQRSAFHHQSHVVLISAQPEEPENNNSN